MVNSSGGSLKNKIFRGEEGVTKTQYIADCLKGGLGQFTEKAWRSMHTWGMGRGFINDFPVISKLLI